MYEHKLPEKKTLFSNLFIIDDYFFIINIMKFFVDVWVSVRCRHECFDTEVGKKNLTSKLN